MIRLPASVERLVWFVDHWSPTTVRPAGLVEIEIPYGRYLYVLPLGKKPVAYADYTFVRVEPPAVPSAPRVPDRGERPRAESSGGAMTSSSSRPRCSPSRSSPRASGMIAGASGFPLDDSWIHLQFARNLAEGAGFSFNPHRPVAGSTAPLWTLLLGAVATRVLRLALDGEGARDHRDPGRRPPDPPGRARLGAPADAALAAAVALMWMGPLVWGSLSGMEVSLAALLVAARAPRARRDDRLADGRVRGAGGSGEAGVARCSFLSSSRRAR